MIKSVDAEFEYIADNAYMPYGEKSKDLVLERLRKVIAFAIQRKCDLLVIACHTASTLYVAEESCADIAIVDALRPTVDLLNTHYSNYDLTFIATKLAIDVGMYQKLVCPGNKVLFKDVRGLALNIENNHLAEAVSDVMDELNQLQLNTTQHNAVVLGCTHYPIMQEFLIQGLAMNNIHIAVIDPTCAIARFACKYIESRDVGLVVSNKSTTDMVIPVFITGDCVENMSSKVAAMLPKEVKANVEYVQI
jgi:glutamate racemase